MSKTDLTGLRSLLNELKVDQLRSLDDVKVSWLPLLEGIPKYRAVAKIMKALQMTDTEEEHLRRLAFVHCWILLYKAVQPWRLFHVKNPSILVDYRTFLERSATELRRRRCDVTLEWNLRDGAVYACLLLRDQTAGTADHLPLYMATWRGKPLLAVCSTKGISRRLVHDALDAAVCNAAVRMLPVSRSDLEAALQESIEHLTRAGTAFACGMCQESFSTREALGGHEPECPDKENQFTHMCSSCSFSSNWGSEMARHEMTHESGNHVCDVCQQVFDCKQSLKNHRVAHIGKTLFECSDRYRTPEK